jgi:hypothetical protein
MKEDDTDKLLGVILAMLLFVFLPVALIIKIYHADFFATFVVVVLFWLLWIKLGDESNSNILKEIKKIEKILEEIKSELK